MLALTLFEMILEAEDQNIEFDMTDQHPRLIRFNQTVKVFCVRPKTEFLRHFKCSHTFWPRYGIANRFHELVSVF